MYACTCSYGNVSSRLEGFDYVFTAKIEKVLEYHENLKRPKRVAFKVLENFNNKLKVTTISLSKPLNTCPVPNPKINTNWLFYIMDSGNGKLVVSGCNPSNSLSKQRGKDELSKIKLYQALKEKNKNKLVFNTVLENKSAFFKLNYSRSKKYTFNNNYGLYLMYFENNEFLKVKHVEVLKSIDASTDQSILNYYNSKYQVKKYYRIKTKLEQLENKVLPIIVWDVKN